MIKMQEADHKCEVNLLSQTCLCCMYNVLFMKIHIYNYDILTTYASHNMHA